MIWVVRLILCATLLTGGVAAAELPTAAVQNATKYLTLREQTGRNDHPEINRMLAYCGLDNAAELKRGKSGYSWCMAFVLTNYKEASEELSVKQPLYRSARCYSVWQNALQNPLKFRIIRPEEVLLGRTIPEGAVTIWKTSRENKNWNGHTGLVVKQLSTKQFLCREGNTSGGVKGSQSNGNGVFDRTRGFGLGTTMEVQGWIIPR